MILRSRVWFLQIGVSVSPLTLPLGSISRLFSTSPKIKAKWKDDWLAINEIILSIMGCIFFESRHVQEEIWSLLFAIGWKERYDMRRLFCFPRWAWPIRKEGCSSTEKGLLLLCDGVILNLILICCPIGFLFLFFHLTQHYLRMFDIVDGWRMDSWIEGGRTAIQTQQESAQNPINQTNLFRLCSLLFPLSLSVCLCLCVLVLVWGFLYSRKEGRMDGTMDGWLVDEAPLLSGRTSRWLAVMDAEPWSVVGDLEWDGMG